MESTTTKEKIIPQVVNAVSEILVANSGNKITAQLINGILLDIAKITSSTIDAVEADIANNTKIFNDIVSQSVGSDSFTSNQNEQ